MKCHTVKASMYQRAWRKQNKEREAFRHQKMHSAGRGIPFLLSFEEWLAIWQQSGHRHERGCKRGQFVMAQFGDCGPYATGNVKIIPTEQNLAERVCSAETRRKD